MARFIYPKITQGGGTDMTEEDLTSNINGERTGKGIYFYPSGNTYVGDFKNNLKESGGRALTPCPLRETGLANCITRQEFNDVGTDGSSVNHTLVKSNSVLKLTVSENRPKLHSHLTRKSQEVGTEVLNLFRRQSSGESVNRFHPVSYTHLTLPTSDLV